MNVPFVTVSGRVIDLADPNPRDLVIGDIAHGLAHVCRFAGHLPMFYSVAEHSLLVMWILYETPLRLHGLLHDASEAYLGDVSRYLKHSSFMDGYRILEHVMQGAIARAFKLPELSTAERHQLKVADNLAAVYERSCLRYRRRWDAQAAISQAVADGFVPGPVDELLRAADAIPGGSEMHLRPLSSTEVKDLFIESHDDCESSRVP